jgi:hypothetical protein
MLPTLKACPPFVKDGVIPVFRDEPGPKDEGLHKEFRTKLFFWHSPSLGEKED